MGEYHKLEARSNRIPLTKPAAMAQADLSPSSSSSNRPAVITLDLILRALHSTFLHPFIAWLVPLCLRAQATPYSHPSFIITSIYASILTVIVLLAAINRRIAYGLPREVDLSEEVVLVAGGASGIGKAIAENYGMRGVSVAVVDVKRPGTGRGDQDEDDMSNIRYYRCDVGDRERLEEVARRIESDVWSYFLLLEENMKLIILEFFFLFLQKSSELPQLLLARSRLRLMGCRCSLYRKALSNPRFSQTCCHTSTFCKYSCPACSHPPPAAQSCQ
jgi:hypothetical protein